MKKTILKKYAQLIVRKGMNVQKGQAVLIRAELDQPDFVKMVVEEAYRAGASKVQVDWSFQPLTKVHYKYMTCKNLSVVEKWEEEKIKWRADNLPARLFLISEDPEGLKGIDQKKYAESSQARFKVLKPYLDATEGKEQWCIAAVPGKAWAKKVFPDLPAKAAVEKLWENILTVSRVDDDPQKAWDEHNKRLETICNKLNKLGIEKLEYHAGNGTDFTVGMIPEARFCGGGESTIGTKVFFNPNIPSEECFISPKRGVAEGIVYATLPYSYHGQLIKDAWFRFKDGKVVEHGATENGELLDKMLNMDEGASYLGECALVPFTSPVNKTGILFYNTLFDENARCHIALGRGYIDTIEDFEKYTLEEMQKMGVNDSMIHEDFMIGTEDMRIIAHCKDGRKVEIMKDGVFAKGF